MVERLRLSPLSLALGVFVVALVGVIGIVGDPAEDRPSSDLASSWTSLPVHQPHAWAFWDQMASAFSAQPLPGDLLDGDGVVFRWWFDTTYVGADIVPVDCAGISLWSAEFERYGFDEGVTFVASRFGPCTMLEREPLERFPA